MIRKRIVSAISGNVLMQAVNALIQVAGIPILLKYWGIEYYGEWLILFTIPSYIAMSDMGLGTSTTSELSMLVEAKRDDEASEILRNTFWFILLIGGIPFLLLGLSLFILPWYEWLHFTKITPAEFKPAFFFLILYIYLALFLTLPLGYYRVRQVYHRERVLSSVFKVLEFGAVATVVIAGQKVITVAIVYFLVRLLFLLYILFELTKRYASFRLFPFGFDYKSIRHLLKPGLSAMTIYAGQNFMLQGLVSIIGIGLGSAQVVVFSTVRTLVNVVKQLVSIVNLSVTSEFSYAYGSGNYDLLKRLFGISTKGNMLMSIAMLIGLYFFGFWIIEIWTGGKVAITNPFFLLILIGTFINTIWNGYLVLMVSTNKLGHTGIFFLLNALLLLLINGFGINDYGLTGVAASIIGFECVMTIIMISGSKHILQMKGARPVPII